MPDYIDLHIHTFFSDGRQSPENVVDDALKLGLKVIALTDHDSVGGFRPAFDYAADKGLEVITGIELSAAWGEDDIHILGYLFRDDDSHLLEMLDKFRQIRHERCKKMVTKLNQLGMKTDFEQVLKKAEGATIGRPHLAEVMLENKFVASYNDAFQKYLYVGGPVYVPKAKLTPSEAIELLHQAGGVAVLAHPALTDRDAMIAELVSSGMDGIEIFHPTQKKSARKKYRQIGEQFGLFFSGGSDSHHRKGRYGDTGDQKVPYEYYLGMMQAWEKRNK